MFTGIVREIGTVLRLDRAGGVKRLTVAAPQTASKVEPLESIAVNGVCLTVVQVRLSALTFEVIPETQRLTTLGRLRHGDRVNLEPSLTLADRLNGHVVLGHIDATGAVVGRRQRAGELVVDVRVPASCRKWLVPKGPVTVDGVSLTVGERLASTTLEVHLIPETLRRTTLGLRRVGDRVNLEFDYLAKLVTQRAQAGIVVKPKRQRHYHLTQLLRGVTARNRHTLVESTIL